MSEKPSKRMGRPPKQIDNEQFRKLCGIQCTEEEIASWFDCSVETLRRWIRREFDATFEEAYQKYSAAGKISLRRAQFKLAETNASMAIWLGKQYLGQREPAQELELGGQDEPFKVNINIADCKGAREDEST